MSCLNARWIRLMLRVALAVCVALLCRASGLWAADVAPAAADGSLWSRKMDELGKSLLKNVRASVVDGETLRLPAGSVSVAGLRAGDMLLQVDMEKKLVTLVSTTLYNKGDDGEMSKAEFDALLAESLNNLTDIFQVAPSQRKTKKKETAVRLRAWEWDTPHCAALLEASATGTGKKYTAEFIRLTIAPDKAGLERGSADDVVKKAELRGHVRRHENGSVWIEGIPMVDQGQKGYCVPASLSRVFAYYGMDGVDQHALAALCSTEQGTTLPDMEKALRSISSTFHMSVTSWEWLNRKTLAKDIQRVAQKKRMPPEMVTNGMLLEVISAKQAVLRKGMKDIKKQIDAGIPIVWAVMLGLFPEPGLPQSAGGHMRLIIGYNEEKQVIFYSDSWGGGHELKSMPLAQACAISMALYVLRPRR